MEYYFPGTEELQTVFDSLKGNNEKSLIENLRNNFARSSFPNNMSHLEYNEEKKHLYSPVFLSP